MRPGLSATPSQREISSVLDVLLELALAKRLRMGSSSTRAVGNLGNAGRALSSRPTCEAHERWMLALKLANASFDA